MPKTFMLYTRDPIAQDDLYNPKLAYSMHIAVKENDSFKALNHNSGVFFAKATVNEDGSLNPKALKAPFAFKLKDGGYGIAAVRTNEVGETDNESIGCIMLAKTCDFLHYTELGLVKICDADIERVAVRYCKSSDTYKICCISNGIRYSYKLTSLEALEGCPSKPCSGREKCELKYTGPEGLNIEGARPSCELRLSNSIADKLIKKLTTPKNISMEFPKSVTVSSVDELKSIKATARYSDGSTDDKRIDWDLSGIDFSIPGKYEITGQIHQDHYDFPITENRADPCVAKWNNKYYFIATNDADGNHTLYIRCADSIPELVNAPETLLLDSHTYEGIGGLLWAPEFHEIDGRLYIFHAATPGEFFSEESHIMCLRQGGDPMNAKDWSRPERIVKMDGSELCEAGKVITLDMTTFRWEGVDYAVWSQRQFLPKDLGAWLYIAKLDTKDPHKLASEPIVLSKPDYGWANNHTFVDEGPFALIKDDILYLSYSSAAVDHSYVVSYLVMTKGKDLLDPKQWVKSNFPALTSRSVDGIYGPGHNAYVTDDDGKVWNTFHGRPGVNGPRSSGIRRVHFDVYGEPVLDVTEELDVAEELKTVKTLLIIK